MTMQNPRRLFAVFAASQRTSRSPFRSFESTQIKQRVNRPIAQIRMLLLTNSKNSHDFRRCINQWKRLSDLLLIHVRLHFNFAHFGFAFSQTIVPSKDAKITRLEGNERTGLGSKHAVVLFLFLSLMPTFTKTMNSPRITTNRTVSMAEIGETGNWRAWYEGSTTETLVFRSIEIFVLFIKSQNRMNQYDFRKSKRRVEIGVRGVAPLERRNNPSWTLISSNSLRSELHTRAKMEFLIAPWMVRSRGASRFKRGGRTIRPCFEANGVYENSETLSLISLLSGAKWSYDRIAIWMLLLSCWWSECSETAPLSTVKQVW